MSTRYECGVVFDRNKIHEKFWPILYCEYADDELSNYVMVMVTNRRSKVEMDRELQLFLGANTSAFTTWLQTVWQKLEQVTITNSGKV